MHGTGPEVARAVRGTDTTPLDSLLLDSGSKHHFMRSNVAAGVAAVPAQRNLVDVQGRRIGVKRRAERPDDHRATRRRGGSLI